MIAWVAEIINMTKTMILSVQLGKLVSRLYC